MEGDADLDAKQTPSNLSALAMIDNHSEKDRSLNLMPERQIKQK